MLNKRSTDRTKNFFNISNIGNKDEFFRIDFYTVLLTYPAKVNRIGNKMPKQIFTGKKTTPKWTFQTKGINLVLFSTKTTTCLTIACLSH